MARIHREPANGPDLPCMRTFCIPFSSHEDSSANAKPPKRVDLNCRAVSMSANHSICTKSMENNVCGQLISCDNMSMYTIPILCTSGSVGQKLFIKHTCVVNKLNAKQLNAITCPPPPHSSPTRDVSYRHQTRRTCVHETYCSRC